MPCQCTLVPCEPSFTRAGTIIVSLLPDTMWAPGIVPNDMTTRYSARIRRPSEPYAVCTTSVPGSHRVPSQTYWRYLQMCVLRLFPHQRWCCGMCQSVSSQQSSGVQLAAVSIHASSPSTEHQISKSLLRVFATPHNTYQMTSTISGR